MKNSNSNLSSKDKISRLLKFPLPQRNSLFRSSSRKSEELKILYLYKSFNLKSAKANTEFFQLHNDVVNCTILICTVIIFSLNILFVFINNSRCLTMNKKQGNAFMQKNRIVWHENYFPSCSFFSAFASWWCLAIHRQRAHTFLCTYY